MADNPEDDFLAANIPAPRPTDPNANYVYGIPGAEQRGIGAQFLNMFAPYRSEVVTPASSRDIPMDGPPGTVLRIPVPGEYKNAEFGFSYMPIVQGVASLFSDPVGAAQAAASMPEQIYKQQAYGADAMSRGLDFVYDPETGQEYRYDPSLLPATSAIGTAASISKAAREGETGPFLGMLATTDSPGIRPEYIPGLKKKEAQAQSRLEAGEDPRVVFEETGFMRINVDPRPDRLPGDAPLETRMVFDIPDNLGQINFRNLLPENVKKLSEGRPTGEEILDAFESLNDSKNFPIETNYSGGKYGRSVKFKLSDVMGDDHPLFDVFPNLGDEINVRIIENAGKGAGGHWSKSTNTIAIDAKYMGSDRYTSTLFVHELMHVLQTRGQIPGGSAPFLVPEKLSRQVFKNFALLESVKFMEGDNFNVASFLIDDRPKAEQDALRTLIEAAKFNVKNANPEAPDNLSKIWPGSLDSSAPVNLETMPYAQEMRAELLRLIAEKEAKTDKLYETYEALGIETARNTDTSGSLRSGQAAQSNYYRTRGEFMARLAEAYALATEGMTPEQRRKLFPMDLSRLDNFVGPSKDAPGGTEGIMGSAVGTLYDVKAGTGKMADTTFVDPSPLIDKINNVKSLLNDPNLTFPVIPKGDGAYQSRAELQELLEILEGRLSDTLREEVPTSEMGLVDIAGLINKDALPPEIRNTLDYPEQSPAIAPKSVNTVLDEIYGQDTSLSVGPFAMPHAVDHKVKLELLPDIDDPQGSINIAGIVSMGERGEGFGTRAMKLITGKADENNLGLTLEVDPVSRGGRPDLSIEDLVTFYEREGFIKVNKNYNSETKTTTYDPIDSETNKDRFGNEWIDEMYRPPVDGRMQSLPKEVDAPTSGALSDLSTPELITSWVIEPSKVNRAEVASRLLSQPDVVARSNQALDTLGYGDTVPMFRLVKLTNDGDLQSESLISATLDPNKVPSNIKFLTEGKFGMTTPTDYRLVRYDVPRDKIAGYLPAVADDIKRTVNRAVKEKGFGQENVPGMTTVTDPAQHAKDLIKLQDEVIADVSGLKPTVLVDDSGRPMNMLSMGGTLPKLIAEGRVTTPEDISELMPNYFALNPMEYARQGKNFPFEVAEKQARQDLISRYQDFFGIQNKAEGGVVSLADVARNMNRGPRGVGSLAPIARNMYKTMVS